MQFRAAVRKVPLFVLWACLAGAQPLRAQETFPYRLDPWLEGGLAASGVALFVGAVAVYQGQEPFTPGEIAALDAEDVNGFDRSATENWSTAAITASDILVWSLLAAPVGLAIATPGSRQSWTLGAMYGEVLLLNNGLMQLIKGVTDRTRPYAYNDDPDIPDELLFEVSAKRSFPSSHTANAFAAAVFLSTTYARLHPGSSARTWVWAGSLTAAGTVGFLRYQAGKHFPTDVIAGAVLGSAIGYLVPKLHEMESVDVMVAPVGDGTAIGLSWRY